MEKIIETKKCEFCNIFFDITDKDEEFYEKVSPIFGGKKYHISTPTICPDCRQQRRLTFRNERKLYRRKCDFGGKEIISMYSPDKPYTVYDQEIWWSDKWDSFDYGKEFDFNKNFFEQFEELFKVIPKLSLSVEKQENSLYTNYAGRNKNCYLIFLGANNEDCMYNNGVWNSKNTLDSLYSREVYNSYEIIDGYNLTNCQFLTYSRNSQDCMYCYNITSCNNCLFCTNLIQKEYYILNQEQTKEEFLLIKEKIQKDISFKKEYIKKYNTLQKECIHKENKNISVENCKGNYIKNSENGQEVYDVENIKDCKYSVWLFDAKNCYDIYDWGATAENCYECHKVGDNAIYVLFSAFCLSNVSNLIYCYDCVNNCHHCFGCIGLRNKSYCILNKQYTKEEYEELVPCIIEHMQKTGEWGEFFPSSISPFGYNETVAQEYFPLSRSYVIPANAGIYKNESNYLVDSRIKHEDDKGSTFLRGPIFNRSDYEAPFPKVEKIIPASKLPNDISSIPDDILNWAIECEVTKKPFRIIKQELEFYRKHHLPIPHKHGDQRHLERMQLRNPRKLFTRHCYKCTKEIQTTYAPERPEIVYCEECYNREVY